MFKITFSCVDCSLLRHGSKTVEMIISELYYSFRQMHSWFRSSKQWLFFFELCWISFCFTCYLNLPCLCIVDGLTTWRRSSDAVPGVHFSLECFVDSLCILWFLTFLKHFFLMVGSVCCIFNVRISKHEV